MGWLLKRKSSTGICFIGHSNNFSEFLLKNFLEPKPGNIINVDTGNNIGHHKALFSMTVGQGAKIEFDSEGLRSFVCAKDKDRNEIIA
ncbi:MAG: hypothetical protein MHPSP_004864, partial [Paramarteilia canceri]